jgi:hypothetical protein
MRNPKKKKLIKKEDKRNKNINKKRNNKSKYHHFPTPEEPFHRYLAKIYAINKKNKRKKSGTNYETRAFTFRVFFALGRFEGDLTSKLLMKLCNCSIVLKYKEAKKNKQNKNINKIINKHNNISVFQNYLMHFRLLQGKEGLVLES